MPRFERESFWKLEYWNGLFIHKFCNRPSLMYINMHSTCTCRNSPTKTDTTQQTQDHNHNTWPYMNLRKSMKNMALNDSLVKVKFSFYFIQKENLAVYYELS